MEARGNVAPKVFKANGQVARVGSKEWVAAQKQEHGERRLRGESGEAVEGLRLPASEYGIEIDDGV